MNEDVVVPVAFFVTVIVLVLGIPLVRAWVRRSDQRRDLRAPADVENDARLARIEAAVESMSIEIERISEGQRFTTRLLSDRMGAPAALPRTAEDER